MKQLKDYAPFYLGCEVIGTYDDKPREGYLTGVNNGGYDCEIQFFEGNGINVFEHPVFNTTVIYAIKYLLTEWKIVDNQMEEWKKRLNQYEKYKNEIRNF